MGIENIDILKGNGGMDDEAVEEFQRQLGIFTGDKQAFIFDRTVDKCAHIEHSMWPRFDGFKIFYATDLEASYSFHDKDLVVIGDPMSNLEDYVVQMVARQNKQLRLLGKGLYEVKPIQL